MTHYAPWMELAMRRAGVFHHKPKELRCPGIMLRIAREPAEVRKARANIRVMRRVNL
jgi:hypothetical protein